MNVGDKIKAIWTDGDEAVGFFVAKDRGYIILESESGKRIVCNPDHIETFEIIEKK